MKKILSFVAVLALAACTKTSIGDFTAVYSFKTSGGLTMATEDTLSVYRPLQTETGWINIVKESDDKVSLVKNVSGGTVIVIPASISGDSLFYTYNRKVAAYITETVNATVDVVVSGKGRLYRSSTLVINESYRGVTPADTLAYEVFNKDFRITTEIPLVFGDNEYRKILVSGDNITTAAEKNK